MDHRLLVLRDTGARRQQTASRSIQLVIGGSHHLVRSRISGIHVAEVYDQPPDLVPQPPEPRGRLVRSAVARDRSHPRPIRILRPERETPDRGGRWPKTPRIPHRKEAGPTDSHDLVELSSGWMTRSVRRASGGTRTRETNRQNRDLNEHHAIGAHHGFDTTFDTILDDEITGGGHLLGPGRRGSPDRSDQECDTEDGEQHRRQHGQQPFG